MRAIVTDWVENVLWPTVTRGFAQANQTVIELNGKWNVTYDVPIVYVNGRRRLGGFDWEDETSIAMDVGLNEGDAYHIFVSPGSGAGYLTAAAAKLLELIDFNDFKGINCADPTDPQDVATKNYVDSFLETILDMDQVYLRADGGNTPSADIPMAGKKFTGLPTDAIAMTDGDDDTYVVSHKQLRDYIAAILWKPGNYKWTSGALEDGWLECDGSEVSRTNYAALFAVIGTKHGGGDGVTTFNLPDFRGRTPVGAGQGMGDGDSGASGTAPTGTSMTARDVGDWFGEQTHKLTETELAAHTHPPATANSNFRASGAGTTNMNSNYDVNWERWDAATGSTGGDIPHNNLQPSLAVRCMVKY